MSHKLVREKRKILFLFFAHLIKGISRGYEKDAFIGISNMESEWKVKTCSDNSENFKNGCGFLSFWGSSWNFCWNEDIQAEVDTQQQLLVTR